MSEKTILKYSWITLTLGMILNCAATRAAESCTDIDLRPSLPPVFDQGGTGWCYAHSVATMIDQVTGKRVSPTAIAIDYALASQHALLSISDPEIHQYIVDNNLADGLKDDHTPEDYVYPRVFAYTHGDDGMTTSGIMDIGGSEDSALILAGKNGVCPESALPSGDPSFEADLDGMKATYLAASPAVSTRVAIRTWLENQCGPRDKIDQPLVPRNVSVAEDLASYMKATAKRPKIYAADHAEVMDEVDANLERGRIAAIGYDYCEHAGPDYQIGECVTKKTKPSDAEPEPHIDHSALIVARRLQDGQCQYFVRNHLGPSCDIYQDKYTSRCEAQAGGVWVNSDELSTLYSVTSIK